MQFGGDDQWSNMLGGTNLIRKKTGKDAYAMTINLLLNSEGKKMGKSASGAVWLDKNKTTPFEFFQYWRNVDDADVMKCIKMLTFIPLDEIKQMETWDDSRINEKKEILAFSLTELVHGTEEAEMARETSHALFSGEGNDENIPATEIELKKDEQSKGLLDILVLCDLAKSKGEARRLVEQGGISVNGEKITDVLATVSKDDLTQGIKIKKGKKVFHKVIIK